MTTVLLLTVNCFSQNDNKVKSLKESIAKSDANIEKKGNEAKTWMDRGKLFQEVYGFNVSYLRFGMPTVEAKIFFKDPEQILTKEEKGVLEETYVYSLLDLKFTSGVLASWKEKVTIVENPLGEAINSYKKAASLDEKGKEKKKLTEAYKAIGSELEKKMFNDYYNQDFKSAYQSAKQKIEVSSLLGYSDTSYYYYAGFFAYTQGIEGNTDMLKESVANFDKALSLNFDKTYVGKQDGGDTYTKLYDASAQLGDSAKALNYAIQGFEKYPTNPELINRIIAHYDAQNRSKEAMKLIERAKASDPSNVDFLYVEGFLYDRMGEKDNAIAAYDAAIKAKPDFFDAYFNKAVIYYNSAIKMTEDANNERDPKKYEDMKKAADDEFMKSVQPLEAAHKLKPDDRNVMETLKTLYFRFRSMPEYEAKLNEMTKKLETL